MKLGGEYVVGPIKIPLVEIPLVKNSLAEYS
jgi:hypothetical protein